MSNEQRAPSEKHLEDWICYNQREYFRDHPATTDHRVIARQLRLPAGRLDLLVSMGYTLQVVELKAGVLTYADLAQALRYMANINDIVNHMLLQSKHYPTVPSVVCSGKLIGYDVKHEDLVLCARGANVDVEIYNYYKRDDSYLFFDQQPHIKTLAVQDTAEEYASGIVGDAIGEWLDFEGFLQNELLNDEALRS